MRPKGCPARTDRNGTWMACELRALHQGDHVWWAAADPVPAGASPIREDQN